MLSYISKRISKQQKSNLVALGVSLLLVGGIAVKNQQQCWDNNGYANGKGALKNIVRNLTNTCVADPYKGFTPPSEISGFVNMHDGSRSEQRYWQTGRAAKAQQRQYQQYYSR